MAMSRRFLPSMSLLYAFEAAARSASFTRAAAELNLTQSAVSRQIRALEDMLERGPKIPQVGRLVRDQEKLGQRKLALS